MSFSSNSTEKMVYETVINDDFMKDSYLKIYTRILYVYTELKNQYHFLKEKVEIVDKNGNVLETMFNMPRSKGVVARNVTTLNSLYYYKIKNDIAYLRISISLIRVELRDTVELNVKVSNTFHNNFVCIKYLKYNNRIIIYE